MYIDDSGCATFKSSEGYSGNEVVHDDYIVLSVAGGDINTVWELLPDIHQLLTEAEISNIKEGIFVTGNADLRSEDDCIRAFIEDIHPEWIKAWFNESLPEISEHLNSTVESYLENLRDRIESEIDAMTDE